MNIKKLGVCLYHIGNNMETSGLLLVSVFCNIQRTPSNIYAKINLIFQKTPFFTLFLWLFMKRAILRNTQLFVCFVNIFEYILPFLKLFSYFSKRIYLFYNNVWQRKMSKIQESKQKIKSVWIHYFYFSLHASYSCSSMPSS